jgi:hypothetical protein
MFKPVSYSKNFLSQPSRVILIVLRLPKIFQTDRICMVERVDIA